MLSSCSPASVLGSLVPSLTWVWGDCQTTLTSLFVLQLRAHTCPLCSRCSRHLEGLALAQWGNQSSSWPITLRWTSLRLTFTTTRWISSRINVLAESTGKWCTSKTPSPGSLHCSESQNLERGSREVKAKLIEVGVTKFKKVFEEEIPNKVNAKKCHWIFLIYWR